MGKEAMDVPRMKLNNGTAIPAVGLGTWQSEPGLVKQAVKEAVKVCITLITFSILSCYDTISILTISIVDTAGWISPH